MNWIDFTVLAVILGFGVIGLVSGFIYSVFRIASFFVSVILAIKFYPVVSEILMKTSLYTRINESLQQNLMLNEQTLAVDVGSKAGYSDAGSIIGELAFPSFFQGTLVDKVPELSGTTDASVIIEGLSKGLTEVIIGIISLILLYILIRIALCFARFILRGIAKLPVFKQLDKVGGFSLGLVEGLLTIYIVFFVFMLFNTTPQFSSIFQAIDSSVIAKYFYEHNFIVGWVF